ncbi:MAG TPA: HAD-IA family hydrolase [Candidatus Saccharimonadia bacterium]|nr:HAD-IA family hydrolase [Candidatus Saccharimonadia bacterium]
MAKPQVRAIIFDLYGVLVINGWAAFKLRHFADREAVWHELHLLGRKADAGLTDYEEMIQFAAQHTGETEAAVRHELEHSIVDSELLEYIRVQLKPHYKLGILSNAGSNITERLFTPDQLDLFDAVVLSHGIGLTKPHPEMYQMIADRLDLGPAECLFVDDHERHIAGAQDVGMRTLLYTDFAQLQADLPGVLA